MRLFKLKHRNEGEAFDEGVVFQMGKSFDSGNIRNGFYFMFTNPNHKVVDYIDPKDFAQKVGLCHKKVILLARRIKNRGPMRFNWLSVWKPVL